MFSWEGGMDTISEKPFFGGGFGISISRDKPFVEGGKIRFTSFTNREHGSSYLAITEWVGLLGILPFMALIVLVAHSIVRVCIYLRRTGDAAHYSVPLMLVLVAGLLHAGFEDWLFAVGYYLTVLFWVFAFIIVDVLPGPTGPQTAFVHGMRFHYEPDPVVTQP